MSNVITFISYSYSVVSKRFRLFLLIGLIFGLLGITKAWLQEPSYNAELSFTTESEGSSRLGTYAAIAAQFGFDMGMSSNSIFEGDNLLELLKSRKMIAETLMGSYTPDSNTTFIQKWLLINEADKEVIKLFDKAMTGTPSRLRDSIVNITFKGIIEHHLKVFRRDKKLNILVIEMKSNDEVFSKSFVEALASNAIQFYSEYKIKKAKQNVDILQRQADSVKRLLFEGIGDVAAVTDLNVNPMRQIIKAAPQKRQVDVQVNGLIYGELLKNLELAKLSLRRETPLIQVIDTPVLPLKKIKPGRLLTGLTFSVIGCVIFFLVLIIRDLYNKSKSGIA